LPAAPAEPTVKRKFDLVAASREQKQQRAASAPAAAAAAPAAAPTVAAQAAAAPAGLPPAPCKISIDEPMLFKVVNTYTRETRTSAKMTDTVIADGRGAFARVVEPIPPQHQVKV
jgi:3-oxoacyl-ACP reductase-like protein